ncbi:MAG: sodium/proline symporter [Planctomycetes bacterium]|nr:sodium/proline symporter [Planctomycetota bacterium]
MDKHSALLLTLSAYAIALLVLGIVAQRRTHSQSEFLLGGRALGPFLAAISASASSSSVWTLLGVSGFAYAQGLLALWLFPACVGGFCLNWFLVAPRIRRLSRDDGSLTAIQLLLGRQRGAGFTTPRLVAVAIVAFSLTCYVAAQFRGAGKSFAASFEGLNEDHAVVIGALVVLLYTVAGGLWAVSLTDTVQGSLMALAALALPLMALVEVGGPGALATGIAAVEAPGFDDPFGGARGASAALAVLTLLGIGLGYPGQPHVVNFFMAIRGEAELRRARRIAIAWACCVYAGMILLGLCGRVLHSAVEGGVLADRETVFFALADQLGTPLVAGLVLAAVLSAIMSTADSQLLVVGASFAHDLRRDERQERLGSSRAVVVAVAIIAVLLALFVEESLFRSVLFAWTALGAAFGPLLLVTLWRGRVGPRRSLVAMLVGFASAVIAYAIPATRGSSVERVLPFLLAFACLLLPGPGPRPAREPA